MQMKMPVAVESYNDVHQFIAQYRHRQQRLYGVADQEYACAKMEAPRMQWNPKVGNTETLNAHNAPKNEQPKNAAIITIETLQLQSMSHECNKDSAGSSAKKIIEDQCPSSTNDERSQLPKSLSTSQFITCNVADLQALRHSHSEEQLSYRALSKREHSYRIAAVLAQPACSLPLMKPELILAVDNDVDVPTFTSILHEGSEDELAAAFEQYGVDFNWGFLPGEDPLSRLTEKFSAWEQLFENMTHRLHAHDYLAYRQEVDCLPVIDITTHDLLDDRELRRAMMVISMLAHGYVFCVEPYATRIPSCLARPWAQLAFRCGHVPILTYSSICLYNWRRWDKNRPPCIGNIACLSQFYGGLDEAHFYLVSVEIEYAGGRALKHMVRAQLAARDGKLEALTNELKIIVQIQRELRSSLGKMYDHCDPYVFFKRVRPFVSGWKGNTALPNGVIYEGVSEQPVFLHGGSNAQSSLIAALDIFFGVRHEHPHTKQFLADMRHYMPRKHRLFLRALNSEINLRSFMVDLANKYKVPLDNIGTKEAPFCPYSGKPSATVCPVSSLPAKSSSSWSLWLGLEKIANCVGMNGLLKPFSNPQFVDAVNSESSNACPFAHDVSTAPVCQNDTPPAEILDLLAAFDACVAELTAFRNAHLMVVHVYILKQIAAERAKNAPPSPTGTGASAREAELAARGTGGTQLIPFLQACRDATKVTLTGAFSKRVKLAHTQNYE